MDFLARALFKILAMAMFVCTLQAQQSAKPVSAQTAKPDSGATTDGIYRNSTFGFIYKIPFGWVDRTKEMTDDSDENSAVSKSILLLAVFERPPEASGDSVNSAVVVAAESAASYPGLRSAEQYFGPLTELTKSKGLGVVNEPYDFRVGETQLVRGDFSKPLGNLTMYQSTLVVIEKGYVVSFTFIGGSEDEVDQLMESLSVGRKEAPVPHK